MIHSGELHVRYVDLRIENVTLAAAERVLSREERDRAARFHFPHHRRRFIAAHSALRAILGTYAGREAASLVFALDALSKPLLAEPRGAIRFNLSHSGEFAAIAVVRDAPVGIDIETLAPVPDIESLAKSCFSAGERTALASAPVTHRLEHFLRGWTRKEAYLKATGDGLRAPLDTFTVSLDAQYPHLVRCESNPQRWLVIPLCAPDGAVAAAVVPDRGWHVSERGWLWR